MATYTIEDFQKLFKTDLNISDSAGKLRASFKLNDVFYPVRITAASRKAISQKSKEIGSLFISLCRDESLFWLIHISKPSEPKRLEITLPVKKIIEIWEKEGLAAAIEAEVKNKKAQKKKKKSRKDSLSSFIIPIDPLEIAKAKSRSDAFPSLRVPLEDFDIMSALQEAMIESAISNVPSDSVPGPETDIEDLLNKKSKDGETNGDN